MKLFVVTSALLLSFISYAQQRSISSQQMIAHTALANTMTINKHQLFFNGAEIRKKFFIDLYIAALYSQKSLKTTQEALNDSGTMALELMIICELISAPKMQQALKQSLSSANDINVATLEPSLNNFLQAFTGSIEPKDKFTILSEPKLKTISVFKNGLEKTRIQNESLRKAVLSIWLGRKPIQYDLKYALLTGRASDIALMAAQDKPL